MRLKKPNFWDYKKPNLLSYLLLPLTFPFIINNFLLSLRKKNEKYKKIKTICVGNIYVGGTAKTPLTIKINNILNNLNIKTATVKKYYPNQIDEQNLLKKKTNFYCAHNRKIALNLAIQDNYKVAIFDDGLQDSSINYDLSIVCFNSAKWIGNGFLIPSGPLREKLQSLSKYDVVFFNGNKEDISSLKIIIKKFNKDIKIFETHYSPINSDKFDKNDKYLIFSGIGNPDIFKKTLTENKLNIVKEIKFPDHYNYTKNDIDKIKILAKNSNAKILTTEKDYIKIDSKDRHSINFFEIELFIKDEDKLIDLLKLNI